jgi:tryptophan synthase alpha chain
MNDLPDLILNLQEAGVDVLEIGIPFSDPIADGPVIQYTSTVALKNGATLSHILKKLREMKKYITVPTYIMSYYNPICSHGTEKTLEAIKQAGVDGLIIPDLPLDEYERELAPLFRKLDLVSMFLYSAFTPPERIRKMCQLTNAFLYLLSGSIITGQTIHRIQVPAYYREDKEFNLPHRTMIGFGIKNFQRFNEAVSVGRGAIVGTAFLEWIGRHGSSRESVIRFVRSIKGDNYDYST